MTPIESPNRTRGRTSPSRRWLPYLFLLAGCRRPSAPPAPTVPASPPVSQRSLNLDLSEPEREKVLVAYFRKPVMGRRASLRDIERIATGLTPILERAANREEVADAIRRIAEDDGITADQAREKWVRLQEADLLLESGGDAEDVSSANAVGVAQWIYETGKRAGLKIDLPRSRALTAQIDPLKREVAWLELFATAPRGKSLPYDMAISREQAASQLPAARARLEDLRERRRAIDDRYDPEKALFAHTRYLLSLYRKFPDLQWVFQAFHGGEAGVAHTLAKYMGPGWKGTPAEAIRHGDGGRHLTYERVYFASSPWRHAAAWSYLYGRGDDHRHYWWKIRAAQEAFGLYRRDRAAFQRAWESLLPGRAKEAMWYPAGPDEGLRNTVEVVDAIRNGRLVALAPSPDLAPKSPRSIPAALRPESAGLLVLLSAAFNRSGGKPPLAVGDLTVPADQVPKPPKQPVVGPPDPLLTSLPGGGPPADFDYHATGWAFDLIRPADDNKRKMLEYAIGYLRDRDVLWVMEETDRGPRRYHVVPNPAFRDALAAIQRTGNLPPLAGLPAPVASPRSASGRTRARPQ